MANGLPGKRVEAYLAGIIPINFMIPFLFYILCKSNKNISYICTINAINVMNEHHGVLCMGSNTNRYAQLSVAREALRIAFPDIRFGEMMETEAVGSGFLSPFSNKLAQFSTTLSPDSIHDFFKELERRSGRIPEDKAQGVVKLDIDLLVFDNKILKPEDMEREYIRRGMSVLF